MFKSEKKNNIQKLVPEIMHLIMYPDNDLMLREDFFSIVNSVGISKYYPWTIGIDSGVHTCTHPHTSIYTCWLKPTSCLADVEIVALFL